MKLKVEKVPIRTLRILEEDGWTVEKLAAANADELTGYEGIGAATAWRIIVAARRANKAERAERPVVIDPQWLTPPAGGQGSSLGPPCAGMRGLSLDPPPPPTLVELPMEALEAKFRALAPDEEMPAMSVRIKRTWLVKRIEELGGARGANL